MSGADNINTAKGFSGQADQIQEASKSLIQKDNNTADIVEEDKDDKEKTGEVRVKRKNEEEQKRPPVNAAKKLMAYAKREY
jgi:hypothetical protein